MMTLLSVEARADVWPAGSCETSDRESRGLICEADADWNWRKVRFVEELSKSIVDDDPRACVFWHNNWQPNFECADSAHWLCSPRKLRQAQCLVKPGCR